MKRFADWLRIIFWSPEFASILIVAGVTYKWPQLLHRIGKYFIVDELGIETSILSLPIILTVATYKMGRDLLNPEDKREILTEWPEYWLLKNRVRAALAFSAGSCVGFIVGWFLIQEGEVEIGAATSMASILVGAFSLVTVAMAKIDGRDVLDGM